MQNSRAISFLLLLAWLLLASCVSQNKNKWKIINGSNTGLKTDNTRTFLLDGERLAWIGTYGVGLYWHNGKRWIRKEGPMSESKYILSLMRRKSTVWVGTARRGAFILSGDTCVGLSAANGLPDNNVWCMLARTNGEVYLGSRYKGLSIRTSDGEIVKGGENILPDKQVTCIAEDSGGKIWAGTVRGGLVCLDIENKAYHNATNGLSGNYIRALVCDSAPRWVGSWDGGLDFYDNGRWRRIEQVEKPVTAVSLDGEGRPWVGTWGKGVFFRKGDKWKQFNAGNSELPSDHVTEIEIAESGKIFFATSRGIAIYNEQE